MSIQFLRSVVLALLLLPSLAGAEDLCEPRAILHEHVRYCYQNWDFLDPATSCVQEYSNMVSAEQARLQKLLNARIQSVKDNNAQHLDYNTNDQILKTSLDEITYLIDYGKQVHTELEDYQYALILPIYDDSDLAGDPGTDPDIRARFMDRECYGDPTQQLEDMELRMRPWIDQLEKTKAQLLAMSGVTEKRDSHLDAQGTVLTAPAAGSAGAPKPRAVPTGSSPRPASTITGTIKHDKLPNQ
jgi:hypothetical protein